MIKRLVAFFLSFVLVFMSIPSFANTSIGGWSALDVITAGANTTINATKTAGGKVLKSAITIAPQAGKVGKLLLRGGAVGALALAVPQLLGEGVDWVLDPANNAIKYKDDVAVGDGSAGGGFYSTSSSSSYDKATALTPAEACQQNVDSNNATNGRISHVYRYVEGLTCYYGFKSSTADVEFSERNRPIYFYAAPADPDVDADGYKSIPIDTVAAKVVSNAEAGHGPSQEAVKASALEGFAAGEHDAALDAGAVESDAGTDNPTDPNNPTDPAEPFDPAGIISAINSLKSLLSGILSSITGLTDFFKSDPPPEPKPEDTNIDIPLPDLPSPDTDITFGGSCPADSGFTANLFGNSFEFVLMPFSKFCPLLSTYIKPVLVVLGSFMAVSIVGGRRDV